MLAEVKLIKTETRENLRGIIAQNERNPKSESSHRKQRVVDALMPPRGSAYCMLHRKVNNKGKYVR